MFGDPLEPVERQQLGRAADFDDIAVGVERMDRVVDVDLARLDAAGQHAAHEVVAVEQRREEAERRFGVEPGGGHVVDDQLEQRLEIAFARMLVLACIAVAARGPQAGEVELVVIRIEIGEEIEHFVEHFLRARIAAVDLVDHDDRAQAQRKRLAGDELGLRHGAFGAVDQQDDAIDHRQDAFDLGAEVGVARRVDDVDAGAVPFDAGALGENGDPAFFFQIVRIHRAFFDALVVAEGARLAEELVDKSGLAVVDVGDDRHVAQVAGHGLCFLLACRSVNAWWARDVSGAPLAELLHCDKMLWCNVKVTVAG